MYYSVFPNWSPWGTFNVLFYRFRPNGNNPDESIFEVMMFVPWKDQANRPAPAKVTQLGPTTTGRWRRNSEPTSKIFQQDSINLPQVQRGLKATRPGRGGLRQLQRDQDPPLLGAHVPLARDRPDQRHRDPCSDEPTHPSSAAFAHRGIASIVIRRPARGRGHGPRPSSPVCAWRPRPSCGCRRRCPRGSGWR